MEFHELFTGGGYTFCTAEGDRPELPCFVFDATDLNPVERFLRGMFVELSVRQGRDGGLAFCLDLPDRDVQPWAIPVDPADLPRLEAAGSQGCAAFIRFPEGTVIDLADHSLGLAQDWTGRVARALSAFAHGEVAESRALLERVVADQPAVPAAHHLLGRCHRVHGDLPEAIVSYRAAVAAARIDDRLLPFAGGPLSDMGVAFKKLGDAGRAVHCFMHSLDLRPNHPEALLSFFSLFANEEKLVLFGAGRVYAIGSRDDLASEYLANYCQTSGRELQLVQAEARRLARRMDLTVWPFHSDEFAHYSAFEKGLEQQKASSPGRDAGKVKLLEQLPATIRMRSGGTRRI